MTADEEWADVVLWSRFPPSWEHIKPLRQFIVAYATSPLGDESAETAGMVTNELLENAVKYGDVLGNVEVEMTFCRSQSELVVRVSNNAQPARIRVLEREFERNQATAPSEAFPRAVGRLRQLPEGTTMLGLARVMSQASLDLRVDGETVTVTARIGCRDPARRSRSSSRQAAVTPGRLLGS